MDNLDHIHQDIKRNVDGNTCVLDDDEDAFLPPDFNPVASTTTSTDSPQFLEDDHDNNNSSNIDMPCIDTIMSQSNAQLDVLGRSRMNLDANVGANTVTKNNDDKILTSPFSNRKEFLRRSISALDDTSNNNNPEYVDLLGLENLEKENKTQIEPFRLWDYSTIESLDNNDMFTESKKVHMFNDSKKIDCKFDLLAADLQAEVDAGTLFLLTINTPLRESDRQSMEEQKEEFTVQQEFISQQKQHRSITKELEREIEMLKDELTESRQECGKQQEQIVRLNIELQQSELSSATEQHVMKEKFQQFKTEIDAISKSLEVALEHNEKFQFENSRLTDERNTLLSDLTRKTEQLSQLEQQMSIEKSTFISAEKLLANEIEKIIDERDRHIDDYEKLRVHQTDLLNDLSTMKTSLSDVKQQFDESVEREKLYFDKMNASNDIVKSLKEELSRVTELLHSKDVLILSLQQNATNSNNRVEQVTIQLEQVELLLQQTENEKEDWYNRLTTTEANLKNMKVENDELNTQQLKLADQLRHAEDLTLLVAADNDALQLRLQSLQGELHAYQLSTKSLENLINEKDQMICTMRSKDDAIESQLFDIPTKDKLTERSSQCQLGYVKEEHEQQIVTSTMQNDYEIETLRHQIYQLENKMLIHQSEAETSSRDYILVAQNDKAKIRSLKRRIGATESLLEDEVNQESSQITKNEAMIRSLQRRIGYMSNEMQIQSANLANYDELVNRNKDLEMYLAKSETLVKDLQSEIKELEEDLIDAYEREDQIQEEFVKAMTYATLEVENLNNIYKHVFQQLQEQYLLVEEELFDALEREEDQKEEQDRLNTEHTVTLKNMQEIHRNQLMQSSAIAELLREEYLMKLVDMFKQYYYHFNTNLSSAISEMEQSHLNHLATIEEYHVSEKVQLFRDFMNSILVKASDDQERRNAANILNEKIGSPLKNDYWNQTRNTNANLVKNFEALEKAPGIQSPRSAFVLYSSTKNLEPAKPYNFKIGAELDRPSVTLTLDNTSQRGLKEACIREVKQHHTAPEPSDALNPKNRTTLTSPPSKKQIFQKSLSFATPQRINSDNSTPSHGVLTKYHSTPKIDMAKAKLRSIESSRSVLTRVANNVENTCNRKIPVKDEASLQKLVPTGRSTVKASNLMQPKQRSGLLVPNSGLAAPKPIDRHLRTKAGPQVQSRITQPTNLKRTFKPKLDTGLANPIRKNGLSNKSNIPVKHAFTSKSIVEARRPLSRLDSQNGVTSILPSKQKLRLSSTSKVALSTTSMPGLAKIVTQNSAARDDLLRKMAHIKDLSSTPLVSHSKRSDLILSMSTTTRKAADTYKNEDPCVAPQLQIPSKSLTSHFMECHFTPIQHKEESSQSLSPDIPLLVTPKAESLRSLLNDAAVKIQARQRGRMICRYARKNTISIIRIQSWWRAYITKKEFHASKRFIVLCQAAVRRKQTVTKLRNKSIESLRTYAAIKIQSLQRGRIARCFTRSAIISVIHIQTSWRAYVCRNNFSSTKRSALVCQAIARKKLAMVASRKIEQHNHCATILQSYWRFVYSRQIFAVKRKSAIVIQSFTRRKNAKVVSLKVKYRTRLASLLQSTWRTKCFRELFLTKKASATLIQAHIRRLRAKNDVQQTKTKSEAATRIQTFYRATRNQRAFTAERASAVTIQKLVRRINSKIVLANLRFELKAATQIQRIWRGSCSRNILTKTIGSIKKIQSQFRKFSARNESVKKRASILKIQSYARRIIVLRAVTQMKLITTKAILIQSISRAMIYRRLFVATRNSIIKIQSRIRQAIAKKMVREMIMVGFDNAKTIQSMWRGRRCRRSFDTKRASVVIIQSLMRRVSAITITHSRMRSKAAIVQIQSTWRLFKDKAKYKHQIDSAIFLQAVVRGFITRILFKKHIAALRLQTFVRMRNMREQYDILRRASIVVQSQVRARLGRKTLEILKSRVSSAVLIQASCRAMISQKKYKAVREAILTLQRWIRTNRLHHRIMKYAELLLEASSKVIGVVAQQSCSKTHRAVKSATPSTVQADDRSKQRGSRKRVALGDISNSAQKISRRNNNKKGNTRGVTSSECKSLFETTTTCDNMDADNVAVALESLSSALKRAKEDSIIQYFDGESKSSLDEVEKLRVIDLRQELKSHGLEPKSYNKLRKSELVALVVEQRKLRNIS